MPKTATIHLVYGNQQLEVDEFIQALTQKILGDRPREWCLERFDVAELLKSSQDSATSRLENFQLSCETPPLFSDRKLIRLDNFDKVSKAKSGLPALLFTALNTYLSQPGKDCFFILSSSTSRELDFSKPLLKSIKKEGRVQKFVSYENNIPTRWVRDRAQKKGMAFSETSANLLIEQTGNDLAELDHALEKLCLFLEIPSDQKPLFSVSDHQLLETLHAHQSHSAFYMIDVLTQKKMAEALSVLEQQLRDSPRDHVKIFMLVVAQFRRLLKIHYLLEQHATERVILAKLKMHPFLAKQLITQSNRFSLVELERIFVTLSQLDLRIKFNADDACILLEDLFQKICTGFFKKHSLFQYSLNKVSY